jgi:predicted DsbA family dithiol-disulfide isomerase
MPTEQNVEILAFTDPVCTWCWGSEPTLRKLEIAFGSQLKIRYVMGGLVEDIRGFYDRANDIGGDPERSNAQIARHWLEASARHGMPVRTEGFRLFSAETVSTYPQNIAFKAAELTQPALAPRYLRRIREASAAEARETGRREVLIELASEVGLDVAAFLSHLNDGTAERAFREDLDLTRRYGARGFPTFVVRYGEKAIMLRGYQRFESFTAVIDTLSEGVLRMESPNRTPESIESFVNRYGRVAPVEIDTVFDLSAAEREKMVAALQGAGRLRQVGAGNGYFLEPVPSGGSCDPVTGVCQA